MYAYICRHSLKSIHMHMQRGLEWNYHISVSVSSDSLYEHCRAVRGYGSFMTFTIRCLHKSQRAKEGRRQTPPLVVQLYVIILFDIETRLWKTYGFQGG